MAQVFPHFLLNSKDIEILLTPISFYNSLLDLYSSAKRRIVLAALYIGSGNLEQNIIQSICKAYQDHAEVDSKNQKTPVSVDILLDATRGTRSEPSQLSGSCDAYQEGLNSLSTLAPLLEASYNNHHSSNINIHLFHSPLLSGILHRILPSRINEIIGVFHTKIFLADDTVILTGANLSLAYLTNRQDRYLVIRDSPAFATFIYQFVKHVEKFSYKVYLSSLNYPIPKHYCCERVVQVPLLSTHTHVAYLCRKQDIPSPIFSPKEFSELLGRETQWFLDRHSKFQNQHAFQSINEESHVPMTLLFVAVQIAFTTPPILHENQLMESLLGPLPSLIRPETHHWVRRLVQWIHHTCSRLICSSERSEGLSHTPLQFNEGAFDSKSEEISNDVLDEDLSTKTGANETTPSSRISHFTSKCSRKRSFFMSPLQNWRLRDTFNSPIYKLVVASGYLNMKDELLRLLVNAVQDVCLQEFHNAPLEQLIQIYMAAPDANSFYRSRGLSKYIPMAYSFIGAKQIERLRNIWKSFSHLSKYPSPSINEYSRKGWTFHSKGLWLYTPERKPLSFEDILSMTSDDTPLSSSEDERMRQDLDNDLRHSLLPAATVIGSSNYGLRSSVRDLDVSFLLVTQDNWLRRMLHSEVLEIQKKSYKVSDYSYLSKRCPLWLQILLRWTPLNTLL